MTIQINLSSASSTTYTEGTPVTLFSAATFNGTGSDDNLVDTVTVKIANPAATRTLSLTSTAATLASNNNVTVTYNAATGTLTLSGNNENDSVWQSILQGVQYNDTSDSPGNPGTVTVVGTNSSNGNTDSDTHAVAITSVNDAPSGATAVKTINEDTAYTFAAADFGFTDVDGNTLLAVKITTLPTAGSLTLNGVAVTVGQTIAAASIATLKFTPVANANGNGHASFTFQVQDNGGTTSGGVDVDQTPNSFTFNVTPVNDAAVLSSATVTLTETDAALSTSGTLTISDVDSPATFVAQTEHRRRLRHVHDRRERCLDLHGLGAQRVRGWHDLHRHVHGGGGRRHATSVTVNILGTNDAAVLSSATTDLTETDAALSTSGTLTISDVDSADDLRGADRHGRRLRHVHDRRGRRMDLHGLGAQRVRGWHDLHRHVHGGGGRRHDDLGDGQHPGHQRRGGSVLGDDRPDRDRRGPQHPRDADDQRRRQRDDLRGADRHGRRPTARSRSTRTAPGPTRRLGAQRVRRLARPTPTRSRWRRRTAPTTSVTVNILGTNDAAVLSSATAEPDRDRRGPQHLRDADDQRRRQRDDLRGADRHGRRLRHVHDRRDRRMDLHGGLGAQRVRGWHDLHRHVHGAGGRRHDDLGDGQHPGHQRRGGSVLGDGRPDRDRRGRSAPPGR